MNVTVLLPLLHGNPGWVLSPAAQQQPWEVNSYVHIYSRRYLKRFIDVG